ncbi:hypothetical protein [Shewanella sp.]|uniref:hypothetical protein n=1 Tax=Shewanella sp. TaxID=50422 RepID=UPI003A9868DC
MTNKESSKRHTKAVNVVHRQWMILKYLSNSSERKTIVELLEYLAAEGVTQSERTIQRDLAFLSGIFPLLNDRDGHDVRWYWERQRRTDLIVSAQ